MAYHSANDVEFDAQSVRMRAAGTQRRIQSRRKCRSDFINSLPIFILKKHAVVRPGGVFQGKYNTSARRRQSFESTTIQFFATIRFSTRILPFSRSIQFDAHIGYSASVFRTHQKADPPRGFPKADRLSQKVFRFCRRAFSYTDALICKAVRMPRMHGNPHLSGLPCQKKTTRPDGKFSPPKHCAWKPESAAWKPA